MLAKQVGGTNFTSEQREKQAWSRTSRKRQRDARWEHLESSLPEPTKKTKKQKKEEKKLENRRARRKARKKRKKAAKQKKKADSTNN